MAMTAVDVIKASGLLKEGFSFQTGAGGASLAAAKYLKDVMLAEKYAAASASAASRAIWWICSTKAASNPCWMFSASI